MLPPVTDIRLDAWPASLDCRVSTQGRRQCVGPGRQCLWTSCLPHRSPHLSRQLPSLDSRLHLVGQVSVQSAKCLGCLNGRLSDVHATPGEPLHDGRTDPCPSTIYHSSPCALWNTTNYLLMSLVPCVLCVFVTWSLTHGRPVYLFPQINPLWSVLRSCWPGFSGVQGSCELQTAVFIYLLTAIG